MGIESGRRKIINHNFLQGQGIHPHVKDLQHLSKKSLTLW